MNNNNTLGWTIFILMLGAMAGLTAVDLQKIKDWSEVASPSFVGNTLGHFSVVVGSFIGGKMVTDNRDTNMRTRAEDKVSEAKVAELNSKKDGE